LPLWYIDMANYKWIDNYYLFHWPIISPWLPNGLIVYCTVEQSVPIPRLINPLQI